jgi:hypothetical protein
MTEESSALTAVTLQSNINQSQEALSDCWREESTQKHEPRRERGAPQQDFQNLGHRPAPQMNSC